MTVDTLNNILMFIAIGLAIFGFYYYINILIKNKRKYS